MSASLPVSPSRRRGFLASQLRLATVSRQGLTGAALVGLVVGMALISLVYTPFDPNAFDPAATFAPPGWPHLAGTDEFGRDIFSRIMSGGQTSLGISCSAVALALIFALVVGPLVGYAGGAVDLVATQLIDLVMAIPALVLALGIVALLGPSGSSVTIALAVAYAPTFVRVFRSVVVATRDQPFVQASRGLGASAAEVLIKDILPNVAPIVAVQATTALAWGIMDEASLGFLGLGVQPPVASWGSLLIEGRQFMFDAPWLPVAAGVAVVMAVLGVNVVGDALRDVLDPRDWSQL